MAPKKLIFGNQEKSTTDMHKTVEDESDEESNSDSTSGEEQCTSLVPPKKPKLSPTREVEPAKHVSSSSSEGDEQSTAVVPSEKKPGFSPTPEEEEGGGGEDASDSSSSPSASGFVIMPAAKPSETKKKMKATPATKVFSDEDEVALLKGLALFWAAGGQNNNWAAFHQFIKGDLPHEFTRTQVSEKIRRLKQKFETNLRRGSAGLSDPHESMLFELSEKLWGGKRSIAGKRGGVEIDGEQRKMKRQKHDKAIQDEQKQVVGIDEDFQSAYPLLCASFDEYPMMMMIGKEKYLIGRKNAQDLEKKWRELKAAQLELELKRIDLVKRDLQNPLQSN